MAPLGAKDTVQFGYDLAGAAVADPPVPVDPGDPPIVRQQEICEHRLVEMCGSAIHAELQILDIGERLDTTRRCDRWSPRFGGRCRYWPRRTTPCLHGTFG
ncbi:MAG TPA: hypothetical protein VKI44_03900, partial [Acetobacteraceae bacterium]|nr:hypothetical protein [Acetobacteraceae bacterium]